HAGLERRLDSEAAVHAPSGGTGQPRTLCRSAAQFGKRGANARRQSACVPMARRTETSRAESLRRNPAPRPAGISDVAGGECGEQFWAAVAAAALDRETWLQSSDPMDL